MAKCLRCGETDLLESDLIGSLGCVSCYGKDLTRSNVCVDCGMDLEGVASCTSTGGTRCFPCYRKTVSSKGC